MDQKLKQRLVGAIVLVSLAVIFIPIIIEGPDDEWTPRVQDIPVPPQIDYPAEVELPAETATVPVPVPETAPPAAGGETPPEAGEATPAAGSTVEPAPATAAQAPAAKPAPAPAVPPATQAPPGSFVIQVGSFSQRPNASGLRDRLRKSGYRSFLQEAATAGGTSWRVLVGPFETRAAAEKQRDRITGEHHLKGMVTEVKG